MGEDDCTGISDEGPVTGTQYLDKQGVDPRFYSEPFLEVSELGDPSSLKQHLAMLSADERRQFLRSVDQHGCTGLLLCAKKGNTEMTKILCEAGAIVNDSDTSGATALHYAAGRGIASAVKMLLDFSADFEAKDERNETPLMWAREERTIQLLLDAGADTKAKNVSGQTALMISCRNGVEDAVGVLARLPGQDLDECDIHGLCAHALAVAAGHMEAADILVSCGATATAKPPSRIIRREEAFLEAARQGNAEACAGFVQDGIDIEAEVGGETALLAAASSDRGRVVVENLLRCRADPNHADAFLGETPLIRTVLNKSGNEMLWMLLEAKADPAREDIACRTAAAVASAWGDTDAADILKAAAAGELALGAMD